ncbi:MAG: hypothetical protein ACYS99_20135, partial [Planctomycetota bacterium]
MPSPIFSAAFAAALVLIASPALPQSVDTVIPLGGSTDGQVSAGVPATVGALIPAGTTKVSLKVKFERGSGIEPELSMRLPDGTLLTEEGLVQAGAKVKVSSRAVSVKKFTAEDTGLYKIVLAGKGGTSGGFTLKIKGRPEKGRKTAGNIAANDDVVDHPVAAADNAFLTVSLKPGRGSALGPSLRVLTASGFPLDLGPFRKEKGSKITVKNLPLPFFGRYVVQVGSVAGTGDYSIRIKVKARKRKPDPSLPQADAGDDGVAPPGTLLMFEGSGSEGATLRWEQVSGDEIELSDTKSKTPTLRAPDEVGTRAWQLVAFSGGVASVPDTKIVEVDQPPVAVGGPSLSVDPGSEVALDGSESFDIDSGAILTHRWRQV